MDILTENDSFGQYPQSYYAATTNFLGPFSNLKENISCDVCIVGGGYTGLSSAVALSELGYDVVLLEAHRVGFGASGRNGGQVSSGQRWNQTKLVRHFGYEIAEKLWFVGEAAKKQVADLIKKHKIECEFCEGIIHAELKKKNIADLEKEVKFINSAYGYNKVEVLDQQSIKRFLGTDKYIAGTIDRGAGHLHPLKYAIGLAKAARDGGVRIFEKTRVVDIKAQDPITLVTKEKNMVRAKKLVMACNGYIGDLLPKIYSRVLPINNFIVATEPLDSKMARSLIKGNFAVADSKFVVNYYKISSDKRLIFGGGENYRYRFPNDIKSKVRKSMLEIYPQLSEIKIDYAWGGTLAVTMTRLPDFQRLNANVYSASGYSGQGVALASLAGKIIAESIKGESKKFDLMSSLPTPIFPGGRFMRWPIMVLGMLSFKLRDKF